jgi:hypothetical protein
VRKMTRREYEREEIKENMVDNKRKGESNN